MDGPLGACDALLGDLGFLQDEQLTHLCGLNSKRKISNCGNHLTVLCILDPNRNCLSFFDLNFDDVGALEGSPLNAL